MGWCEAPAARAISRLARHPSHAIIERVSEWERNIERGMYGRAVPIRPSAERLTHCLRGHNLTIAGSTSGYHQHYNLDTHGCNACWDLRDPWHTWALIDPAHQHTTDTAPGRGLVIVRIPPDVRGGIGQLQLRLEGVVIADLDLAVCGPCRRAVLEQVRADERRRGFGRTLVAAALTLAPAGEYGWSTTKVDDDPVARAFWAGIGWPGALGAPDYCTDMLRAAGELPDW